MKKFNHAKAVVSGIVLALLSPLSWACSPVAKVIHYSKADMKSVAIIRAVDGDSRRPARDMLCAGDRVKVFQGVRVTVKYLTRNKLELELHGPAELPVTRINLPTKLVNSGNMLADVGKWFGFSDLEPSAAMVTRGGCLPGNAISTPLDNGHEIEMPFMLTADLKKLHFFWCGGAAPYHVEVVGEDGQVLAAQDVSEPSVSLGLAGVATNKTPVLSVRSSDGMTYSKKLLFRALKNAADADDPFKPVVDLLFLDAEENWRLQLWSYLQEQKDSSIRSTVMEHLQAGDM